MLSNGLFFFFQAEDGIRDLTVTGVQTCALPISRQVTYDVAPRIEDIDRNVGRRFDRQRVIQDCSLRRGWCLGLLARSEERRGGKECRSRWSPYHLKKKKNHREAISYVGSRRERH